MGPIPSGRLKDPSNGVKWSSLRPCPWLGECHTLDLGLHLFSLNNPNCSWSPVVKEILDISMNIQCDIEQLKTVILISEDYTLT